MVGWIYGGSECFLAKMFAGLLVNVKPVLVSGCDLSIIWGWKDYGGA